MAALLAALLPALPTLLLRLVGAVSDSQKAAADDLVAARLARRDERLAQRDVLLAEQGTLLTRLLRPAFAYPLALYYGAVIADSVWFHSQSVQKLPEPIGAWSGWIVAALFIADSGERVARTLTLRK